MDTSEIYIKLCEKAKKIQNKPYSIWEPGDFYCPYIYPNVTNGNTDIKYGCVRVVSLEMAYDTGRIPGNEERYLNLDAIWLPRQDQLQKIVGDYKKCVEFLGELLDPYAIIVDPYFGAFTSMEQLWLALVMHKKYGKVWDGQDWKTI